MADTAPPTASHEQWLSAREIELLREIRVNFGDLNSLNADWRNEARNLLLRIEQSAAAPVVAPAEPMASLPVPQEVREPKLPEPDTTRYAQWHDEKIKYHSVDQILEFANARVRFALLHAQRVAPQRDSHFGGSSYEASMLRNLLAVIHGDGGHYLAQHGLDKAAEDAEALVATWRAQRVAPVSDELPPLPEPDPAAFPSGWVRYTADQMHAYARTALAGRGAPKPVAEYVEGGSQRYWAWTPAYQRFELGAKLYLVPPALHPSPAPKDGVKWMKGARAMADRNSMKAGGRYNWKNQPERLVYIGRNWSGNGYWNQFEKVGEPDKVWCEVLDSDLHMIEETQSAAGVRVDAPQEQPAPSVHQLCRLWFDEWELILPPDARESFRNDLLPSVGAAGVPGTYKDVTGAEHG